jgi:hypothetical protein
MMMLSLRGLSLPGNENLPSGAKGNLRQPQVLIPTGIYMLLTMLGVI